MKEGFLKKGSEAGGRSAAFGRTDWILFGGAALVMWLFLIHPDIMETSNHSYILLDGIFHGHFADFYDTVRTHQNELYYINGANYNIFIYLLFALWQLPVYLFSLIFSLPMNETFYFIWSKGLPVASFILTALMFRRLAAAAGVGGQERDTAMFAYLLHPVAFFAPVIMGQYDTFCLFFILWALVCYQQGSLLRFSVLMGIAVLGKFFAAFPLIPLLLLKEKRPLRLLKFGIAAMFPLAFTSLIFRGSDSSQLLSVMTDRLFEAGIGNVSLFFTAFALLCVWCFLKKESSGQSPPAALIPFAVYGILFLLIPFHPQWILLFIPFWLLTVFLQKNRQLYFYLGIILSVGFILYSFSRYPRHFELNLFGFGLLRLLGNSDAAVWSYRPVSEFLAAFPLMYNLCRYLFPAALAAVLFARLPLKNGRSFADLGEYRNPKNLRLSLWLIFILGIGGWAAALAAGAILR